MYGVSFKIGPIVLLQKEIDQVKCDIASAGYFSWVSFVNLVVQRGKYGL